MARVRFTGSKKGGPIADSDPGWDPGQFPLFDPDYWRDPAGGQALWKEIKAIPADTANWIEDTWYDRRGGGRPFGQRVRDAWDTGMAVTQDLDTGYFPNWMHWARMAQPAKGAMIAYGALDTFASGTAGWRPQTQAVTYQGNQGNQGGAYQYQPTPYVPAAGANLSNADVLAQKQYAMIAARKAERLASMPAWMKDMANTPIYNQAPAQGFPQGGGGGYYQAAPSAQQMYQAQGRYYQPAGNPYAGRVDPSMRRGPNWEKQHNKWVQLRRAARLKVKG